jgi:hypothetical protein
MSGSENVPGAVQACHELLAWVIPLLDDKSRLADWRELIRERLAADRLLLHPRKAHIYQTRRGISLLGYTVFPDFRRLRAGNGYRFFRRLRGLARAYADGRIEWRDIDPSVQAWIGHARHADTLGLRRKRFAAVTFTRGSGPEVRPCCAGRLVEQRAGQRAFGGPQQEHTR